MWLTPITAISFRVAVVMVYFCRLDRLSQVVNFSTEQGGLIDEASLMSVG